MLRVHDGVAGQGEPCRGRDAMLAQAFCTVALRREHEIELPRLGKRPLEVEMRVDGPKRRGTQLAGYLIMEAVVDVQIEIEAFRGDPTDV